VKTLLIEDRDTTLYLTAESVIEGERYDLHWRVALPTHPNSRGWPVQALLGRVL
jgi:hypothetical protein